MRAARCLIKLGLIKRQQTINGRSADLVDAKMRDRR
jgi:hypothetical protein